MCTSPGVAPTQHRRDRVESVMKNEATRRHEMLIAMQCIKISLLLYKLLECYLRCLREVGAKTDVVL